MTNKRVWRYWCDFCRKGSLSGGHMRKHEKHCTANPNRICNFHVNCEVRQRPIGELKSAIDVNLTDAGLASLRELASNCPMCMLAAIRQSGCFKWDGDPENPPYTINFDFKEELKSAWDTINNAKSKEDEWDNRG